MPSVEGLTPEIIWYTLYGLFAGGLLFLIGFRVYDAIHTIMERKKQQKKAEEPDFADRISKKVITDLGSRFEDIEKKLDNDKARLDAHEILITGIQSSQKEVHDGLSAIAKFMLVISTYGDIGKNDKVKEASAELQKFLAEKL